MVSPSGAGSEPGRNSLRSAASAACCDAAFTSALRRDPFSVHCIPFHSPGDVAVEVRFTPAVILHAAADGLSDHAGQQLYSRKHDGRKDGGVLPDVDQFAVHAVERYASVQTFLARGDAGKHGSSVPAFFRFVDGRAGGEHDGSRRRRGGKSLADKGNPCVQETFFHADLPKLKGVVCRCRQR